VVAEIVATVAILAVVGLYLIWTAARLDRLHARVDTAAAALDAQLDRRASMVRSFSHSAALPATTAATLQQAAAQASQVRGLGHDREVVENALTRALSRAVAESSSCFTGRSAAATGMHNVALRAGYARGFYNDAVRDALVVRDRRIVRWLRLAGHAPHPAYFEMDDAELPVPRMSVAVGPTIEA
jgi:hypothetical protein